MIQETLKHFGQSIGIKNLEFNQEHVIQLEMEDTGSLYFEEDVDDLLIYFIRPLPEQNAQIYKKALSICHLREKYDIPSIKLNAGIFGDDKLVFLIRLAHTDIALPTIDKCIKLLLKLHKNVEGLIKK